MATTKENHVPTIDRTVNITNRWLDEVMHTALCADRDEAYSAMRASLMALRDRLPPDEAADLAAQLPTLIRGVYFEGFKPAATPTKERKVEDFLRRVQENLGARKNIDPAKAVRGTLKALDHHINEGEIDDVRHMMPDELKELWPKH